MLGFVGQKPKMSYDVMKRLEREKKQQILLENSKSLETSVIDFSEAYHVKEPVSPHQQQYAYVNQLEKLVVSII